MDIEKCLEILSDRAKKPMNTPDDMPKIEGLKVSGQSHVFESDFFSDNVTNDRNDGKNTDEKSQTRVEIDKKIDNMTLTEVLNLVTTLQAERVQMYRDYNNTLKKLIEIERVAEYPILCREMTTKFSVVSKYIIKAKDCLRKRHSREDLAKVVESLQDKEKEKLTIIAALHLDTLKKNIPAMSEHLSQGAYEHIDGGDYTSRKIQEIELSISDDLEVIVGEKSAA